MKRFRGFTLAEVLIVITILGVVAALTLPMLIENIDNRIMESQNKKAKAVLASGIKMLTAQNGSPYLKDTNLKRCGDNSECIAAEMKKVFKITEDSITSPDTFNNMTYLMDEDGDREFNAWDPREGILYSFQTADGAIYGILSNKLRTQLDIVADVNGAKNPNTKGSDLCLMRFDETAQLVMAESSCPKFFNEFDDKNTEIIIDDKKMKF